MTDPAEVRLDPVHEAAIEEACSIDRAYFADHPDDELYVRRPVDHELCGAFTACLDHRDLLIQVINFGDGLRARLSITAGARA